MTTRGVLRPEAIGKQFTLTRVAPPDDLAAVVEKHWIVSWDLRGKPSYRSEVITHPCVNLCFEPHGAHVYGVQRPRDARTLSGSGWCVGTKFRPGGFHQLYGRPVSELTDRVVPAAELFGVALVDPGDDDGRMRVHQQLIRERLIEPDDAALLVRAVVEEMLHAEPGARVDAIARRHGVSARTLQRLFAEHVGVSPKWVLQRYRMHEAAERLAAGETRDWARVALDLGYFDQPHFVRDFRAFIGRSPSQYVRECAALHG